MKKYREKFRCYGRVCKRHTLGFNSSLADKPVPIGSLVFADVGTLILPERSDLPLNKRTLLRTPFAKEQNVKVTFQASIAQLGRGRYLETVIDMLNSAVRTCPQSINFI